MPAVSRLRRTSGVLPMSSVTSLAMRIESCHRGRGGCGSVYRRRAARRSLSSRAASGIIRACTTRARPSGDRRRRSPHSVHPALSVRPRCPPRTPPRPYVVRNSKIHGRGVFATRTIRKGTRIIEYRGDRTTWDVGARAPGERPRQSPSHVLLRDQRRHGDRCQRARQRGALDQSLLRRQWRVVRVRRRPRCSSRRGGRYTPATRSPTITGCRSTGGSASARGRPTPATAGPPPAAACCWSSPNGKRESARSRARPRREASAEPRRR